MKKTALLPTLISAALLTSAHADEKAEYVAIPGAIHLEGVGALYGAAGGVKNIGESDYDLYAGVAGGDANALAFAVTNIALWGGKLNYFYAQANDATIETQYQRGGEAGREYEQDLTGNVHHLAFTKGIINDQISSTVSLTRSSVALDGYSDSSGNEIVIGKSGLHDINTTTFTTGLTWDNRTGTSGLEAGSKANVSLKFDSGRVAQSDQGTFEYKLSHHINIGSNALASFYLNGSHAFIVSKATKYDSESEVRNAIKAECDTVINQEQKNDCLALEQDLTQYITASNNHGTAKAVGGSQGLRSYQESFFRGSNSLVEGVELQWQLPESLQISNDTRVQLIGFAEAAQVADNLDQLSSNSRYSIGTGLRAYVGENPVRLEFAHGEDGNAFLLTAGLVF